MPYPDENGATVYEPASSSLSGNHAGTLLGDGEAIGVGAAVLVVAALGVGL